VWFTLVIVVLLLEWNTYLYSLLATFLKPRTFCTGMAQEQDVIQYIKEYTHHPIVELTTRGNAAIFVALSAVKAASDGNTTILIPDQGGWMSFETYPELLGLNAVKVKTNQGLIDLADLEQKAARACAFLVTSFAGYCAVQDMSAISKVCRKMNCLLIEDCSGALGDKELVVGEEADILVCSFGRWKVIDNGYGGFISFKTKELHSAAKSALSTTNFAPQYDQLAEKLKQAQIKIKQFYGRQEMVKQDLIARGINVIHPKHKGLNVIATFKDESDKEKILKYTKEHHIETVECPVYIRLMDKALSLELKRTHPRLQTW